MKTLNRILRYTLIILFWIGVWWAGAAAVGKPLLLPYPPTVFARLFELLQTKEFYLITGHSLWNVLRGILIAVLLGSVLSFLSAQFSFLRELLLPLMTVIKATPVASFIILLWLFIGSARVPTFITGMIVLPVVWTNLDQGWRNIDPQLKEMAAVYKIPMWRRLCVLTLPSLKPYFISACRTSIGLAWKAGIAAEIIVRPRDSIGLQISDTNLYLLTEDMFAWTLVVILLSLLIESIFSFVFEKKIAKRRSKEVHEHA